MDRFTTEGAKKRHEAGKFQTSLAIQAKVGMLPTPTAHQHNAGTAKPRKDGKTREDELNHLVSIWNGKSSQLNPRFVAEMMGFPPNWTELPFLSGETKASKVMETQSAHK
jgi:hypothetical protein